MNILFKGEPFTSIHPVTSGKAPDFSLPNQKGETVTLSELTKPVLISVFPDINTATCSVQTKHFNVEAAKHTSIEFLSLSSNTVEEQKNWCAAEGVGMTILSDEHLDFGKKYGLVLEGTPRFNRLARAVYVIKDGEIVYSQIVEELASEPNYEAALKAALN